VFKAKYINLILFACLSFLSKGQTVTGFISILQSASALGCGCTGCNDAAYTASVTYPDPNGGCGTTEPSASSGGCATLSKTFIVVIPTGCAVTVNACMQDRAPGCTGSTHGPGMDAGDQFSIVGSGGTVNGNSGVQTGASNAQICTTINQTGGQIAFNLTANRVAELLTYTIAYSGAGCLPNPLPVELIDFSVEKTENELNVFWTTATEHNSKDFEIEYSYDAIYFHKIVTVPAAGESKKVIRYKKMLPDTFKNELLYLRLKQNDKDDAFYYSRIIYVTSDVISNFRIMPSPTDNGEVTIVLKDNVKLPAGLEIVDLTGRKLAETELSQNVNRICLNEYDKGVYFFRINLNGKIVTRKVISR
jgi:hypothetical protein